MFERFDHDARRVVVEAQTHARLLGHPFIGSEHLLLSIADVGAGAAAALRNHVSLARLTELVAQKHDAQPVESAHIPFTASAKTTLELALREALVNGVDSIGTGTLLLGVLRDDGAGRQVLVQADVDVEALRRDVVAALQAQADIGPVQSTVAEDRTARPWPSPRCHGCREPIATNAQLHTLDARDRTTGAEHRFQFLYCGSCGTAFAIERVKD